MAVTKSPRLGLDQWSEGTDLHPNRAEWNAQQALLDDVVAMDQEVATWADRPAPKRGLYLWVVDEQRLYRGTATGWQTTAKIGGGGRGTQITIGANSAAVEGTSSFAARADHTHTIPYASATVDGAMSKADKAKLDAATASAVASSIVTRDTTGKSAFDSVGVNKQPALASDLTRKDYVDAKVASEIGSIPLATSTVDGLMPKADKDKLDKATGTNTPNTVVSRDGTGAIGAQRFLISDAAPTLANHAARKDYVDSTLAGALQSTMPFLGSAPSGSINSLLRPGVYHQGNGGEATPANGYPWNSSSGTLIVANYAGSANAAINGYYVIQIWIAAADGRMAFRSTGNGGSTWRVWTELASTSVATASADGLMSKADKADLDKATNSLVPNSIMRRDAGNRVNVGDPVASYNAASKGYVDNAVGAIPTATQSANGLMSSTDKALLDSATPSSVANSLVRRNSVGEVVFDRVIVSNPPVQGVQLTNRDYVNNGDSSTLASAKEYVDDIVYGPAKIIPNNSNIDDFITPGDFTLYTFYSMTGLPAGMSSRAILEVRRTAWGTGGYIIQRITDHTGNLFIRGKVETGTWPAWKKATMTTV